MTVCRAPHAKIQRTTDADRLCSRSFEEIRLRTDLGIVPREQQGEDLGGHLTLVNYASSLALRLQSVCVRVDPPQPHVDQHDLLGSCMFASNFYSSNNVEHLETTRVDQPLRTTESQPVQR